jgi:hypothetical protein
MKICKSMASDQWEQVAYDCNILGL